MKIGELAKQAGCPVETVRYYEREGLLPAAVRDQANNYRRYDHGHVERLTFIRRCRALDMTHGEIRALLQARVEPDASCESINELIDAHLQHVQARMAELQALERQLIDLRGQCLAARATRDCGILRELDQPGDVTWRGPATPASHLGGSRCGHEDSPLLPLKHA
nr:Cd(II)/Pb(II)-responsive transcriptional regulator [uncultured Pseudogulbenkiania sp.]